MLRNKNSRIHREQWHGPAYNTRSTRSIFFPFIKLLVHKIQRCMYYAQKLWAACVCVFFCCCCFVFRFGFGSCCAEAVYMRFANELSIFFSVVFRYWRLERSASIIYWRVHVYAYRCVCTMSKLYNFASMFVIFCFSSLAFIRMLRSISFCRNYFA